jgi:hypothetical protein
MPTLHGLLAPLVLGSGVVAKPSGHDPATAPLAAAALADVDAELGACVEVAAFPGADAEAAEALLAADCVVATGSDATLAALAPRVAPPRRFVGRGHRFSVAAIGPDALAGRALAEAAGALALDVALWDQLGCLSPVSLHVVGAGPRVPEAVADALVDAFEAAEARWPRGRVTPAAAAALAHERAEAELRAAVAGARPPHAGCGSRFTLAFEPEPRLRTAPGHRFLRVHAAPDTAAFLDALAPASAHLAGVGLAGFGAETGALAEALARLGASRVCALGTLQAPPLAWCHDNQGVVLPLARLCDVEIG